MTRQHSFYPYFKYGLYLLLLVDCAWYMLEDFRSAEHLIGQRIDWAGVSTVLAQSVDSWAWLGLLFLFEYETSVLPAASLNVRRHRRLQAARIVCYVFVFYACYGYFAKVTLFIDSEPLALPATACTLVDQDLAYIHSLDDYEALTADNCAKFSGEQFVRLSGANLVGTPAAVQDALWLALTELINSIAWICVAVLLEIEVWIELIKHRRDWLHGLHLGLKIALYTILAGAAVYWGMAGTFIDFWDASLWIVAFLFIEMNVFKWGTGEVQAVPP
jgi:hypothetical protein